MTGETRNGKKTDKTKEALYGLAKAIDGVAKELQPLYKIEDLNENIGELASALHSLANAAAMFVIANHGSEDDRAIAVKYLKRHFDVFAK